MIKRTLPAFLLALALTACSGPSTSGPERSTGSHTADHSSVPHSVAPSTPTVELLPPVVQPGQAPADAAKAEAVLLLGRAAGELGPATVDVIAEVPGEGSETIRQGLRVPARLTVPAYADDGAISYRVRRTDAGGAEAATRPVSASDGSWRLVFDDQFHGTRLGQAWSVRRAAELETCGRRVEGAGQHSRNRLAYRADMVRVTEGVAVLGITGRARSTVCPDGRILRAAGHIGTEQSHVFRGARHVFAARMKMPEVDGTHSGFWIRGTGPATKSRTRAHPHYEDQAEVDVAESFGPNTRANCSPGGDVRDNGVDMDHFSGLQTNMYFNYTGQGRGPGGFRHCLSRAELRSVPGFEDADHGPWDGYHVYAVEWVPDRYYRIWYDGVPVKTFTGEDYSSGRASFLVLSNLIDDGPATYTAPWTQKHIRLNGEDYAPGNDYLTPRDLSALKVDWVRAWRHER